ATGTFQKHQYFDMYSGDVNLLLKFLKEIPEGYLVLVASFDDPGTKLNPEVRTLLSNLGSVYAKDIGFRDSWVFLGAKDIKDKSPFEEVKSPMGGPTWLPGSRELLEQTIRLG
ncbi:protein FAM3D-like, partial [Gracilinanus agilis]|uniref:protein FAM3D-like n=1 Tax=Gracilinanus agilis TaxID=191870 RepID=UPI001CFCCDD3